MYARGIEAALTRIADALEQLAALVDERATREAEQATTQRVPPSAPSEGQSA